MNGGKKHSSKKKIIIPVVAVLAAGSIIYACAVSSKAQNTQVNITCSALKKTNLQDTISVTGTVSSRDSHNVYTAQTYPVAKVSASVGDKVKKGDILAVLDTSSLEKDFQAQKDTLQSTSKSAAITLEQAKDSYETALYLYNHDMDSGVAAAQTQLDSAESSLKTEKDQGARDKLLYEKGQLSKIDLNAEEEKLKLAQSTYDSAVKSLLAAQQQAQQSLKSAKSTYEDAVNKNADKTQQATLDKLQTSLNDCIITAPADGTVTVCNATVGMVPTGVLFTVEDTGNLQMEAEVREIDTEELKAGDKATVTTDVTGKEKMAGTVISVAPAATRAVQTSGSGTSANTSNATFTTKIAISGNKPAVKIGMKAKANIVLSQKKDIYVIPYDSLIEKNDGTYAVMAAEKSGYLYKAEEIPVKQGMQTDVAVEISGAGLKDGLLIISDPSNIKSGDSVLPSSSSASGSNSGVGA